jgi:hypothetical protein
VKTPQDVREDVMGFEHQQPSINLGFFRPAPQQQQVGVRLNPNEKKPTATDSEAAARKATLLTPRGGGNRRRA